MKDYYYDYKIDTDIIIKDPYPYKRPNGSYSGYCLDWPDAIIRNITSSDEKDKEALKTEFIEQTLFGLMAFLDNNVISFDVFKTCYSFVTNTNVWTFDFSRTYDLVKALLKAQVDYKTAEEEKLLGNYLHHLTEIVEMLAPGSR